jgi:arylformamidase
MRYWDISYPLQPGIAVWPGDPEMQLQSMLNLANGASVNSSQITLGSHTGTHVDAPAHIIPGGQTVEWLPFQALLGPASVIDCRACPEITAEDLHSRLPAGCRRVLIKTTVGVAGDPGSMFPYSPLTNGAAQWLIEQQVLLVGLSSPSVDVCDSEDMPVHKILLQAGIVIVERLALEGVPDGLFQLCCLPLRLVGADGSPVRAILSPQ